MSQPPTRIERGNDNSNSNTQNSNSEPRSDQEPARTEEPSTVRSEPSPRTANVQPRSRSNVAVNTAVTSSVEQSPKIDAPITNEVLIIGGIIAILAVAGAASLIVRKYRTTKQLALQTARRSLDNVRSVQQRLREISFNSDDFGNIHGIGVGSYGRNEGHFVQVFVEDASKPIKDDLPIGVLPKTFRDDPIELIQMPRAYVFANTQACGKAHEEATNKRLSAGSSIGNAHQGHTGGTIGFFCEPADQATPTGAQKPIYVLSNEHVLAKMRGKKEERPTCVVQPGKNIISSELVANLSKTGEIDFKSSEKQPNRVDAAIAKLNATIGYSTTIKGEWEVDGHLDRESIVHGMPCKKYGSTSFETRGYVYSRHVAIWVSYLDNGKKAFFDEQILILPNSDETKFGEPGDSGSLVLNDQNKAIGLLFAGSEGAAKIDTGEIPDVPPNLSKVIKNYGLANCISDVLSKLNVKLVED